MMYGSAKFATANPCIELVEPAGDPLLGWHGPEQLPSNGSFRARRHPRSLLTALGAPLMTPCEEANASSDAQKVHQNAQPSSTAAGAPNHHQIT